MGVLQIANSDTATKLLTQAERYAAGKALRQKVPREDQAAFKLPQNRDPLAILKESDSIRIPELVPLRFTRMKESAFAFYRGAAALMAQDLSTEAKLGLPVQACGDCHLLNFGAFETPEGRVLFDINDFDETLPGVDFTYDLKRLTASVAVAAIDAGNSDKKAKAFAKATAQAYRKFMFELAALSPIEIWQQAIEVHVEAERLDDKKLAKSILSLLIKADKALDKDGNFPHLVSETCGTPKIKDHDATIFHFDQPWSEPYAVHTHEIFARYRHTLLPERQALFKHYALKDIAFKVVGVGSVGTFCAVGLFMTADQNPIFLQVKQANASVLERLVGAPEKPLQQGQRVVEGQRALQAASDIFLGWTEDKESQRQFYVRILKNRRLGTIGEVIEAKALQAYANLCGRTLARAHARSGDPAMISGYMGQGEVFDDALADFAVAYADQTSRDFAQSKEGMEALAKPVQGSPLPS